MKPITLGVALVAAALLAGCIVVPPRHHRGDYRERGDRVTVIESPRGGYERDRRYDRDGRDYGPPPRRGW